MDFYNNVIVNRSFPFVMISNRQDAVVFQPNKHESFYMMYRAQLYIKNTRIDSDISKY